MMNIKNSAQFYLCLTSLHLLVVLAHVVRADVLQKSNIIIAMIFGHFFLVSFMWTLTDEKTNAR